MSDTNIQEHRELALRGVPLSGLLNWEEANTVLKTVWKDAPAVEVYKAAKLCVDFGLHPLMKHVFLIKYGNTWATVLGIGATRLMMSRQGTFSYTDNTPRVMSEDEQKYIFGKVDALNVVAITKLRTKDGLEAQGYGRFPKADKPMGVEKGNSVENMAFIRSERNAFGRLFPDAQLPRNIEVVDETYMPSPERVDVETGEIMGDTPPEIGGGEAPESSSTQEHAEASPSPSGAVPQAKVTVKHMNINGYQAWQEKSGKPTSEVVKVLGGAFPGTWLNGHPGSGYEDIVSLCEKAWGAVPAPPVPAKE